MADRKVSVLIDIINLHGAKVEKELKENFKKIGDEAERQTKRRVSDEERASRQVDQIHKQTARQATQTEKIIEQATKARLSEQTKAQKRAADDFLNSLKRVQSESSQAASKSSSTFSAALGGSFFGNLGANAVGFFTAQLAQLPQKVADIISETIRQAEEQTNALKGLQSAAIFKGFSPTEAETVAKSLRLVKAGVVDLAAAASGEKSLLQFGFTIEQSRNLLERFSDSAAFGKQSALSYSEAVSRTAEGVKQFNSGLADAGGMTTNLSVIMEKAGVKQEDFTNKQTAAAAITKYYNALMEETAGVVGDADRLVVGYTGSVSALETAKKNLYTSIGKIITQNPELVAALRLWTNEINGVTEGLEDQDQQQAKTFSNLISWLAKATIKSQNYAEFTVAVFKDVTSAFGRMSAALYGYLELGASGTLANITRLADGATDIINGVIHGYNAATVVTGGSPISPIIRDTSQGSRQLTSLDEQFQKNLQALDKYFQTEKGYFERSRKAIVDGADRLNEFEFLLNGNKDKTPGIGGGYMRRGGSTSGGTVSGSSSGGGSRKSLPDVIDNLSSVLDAMRTGTMVQESGGNQFARNKRTGASGLFQVMPSNIPEWTKRTLGTALSIDQFNNSPQAQIAVFNKYMGEYLEKAKKLAGGDPEKTIRMAAAAWYGGEGAMGRYSNSKRFRANEPSFAEYTSSVYARTAQAMKGKNFRDIGDETLQKISEEITNADREKTLRALIEFYKRAGLVPSDELIADFQKILAKEATGIQPSVADTRNLFRRAAGIETVQGSDVGGIIDNRIDEAAADRWRETLQQKSESVERFHDQLRESQQEAERQAEDSYNRIRNIIGDSISAFADNGWKGLFDSVKNQFKRFLLDMATEFLTSKIFGFLSGKGFGAQGGGIGSILGNLGGLFGGGGMRSTPSFNPSASGGGFNLGSFFGGGSGIGGAGGSAGGGIFGTIRNLFGGGSGGGAHASGSAASAGGKGFGGGFSGMGAGLGAIATIAGSAIGGKWGNALSMAGMGAQVGAMFGPWGAAIGAGIGGGIGLFKALFGGGDSKKKLKQAAQSAYGVSINDDSILKQLEALGKAYFGTVAGRENEIVQLDEAKSIIEAYAQRTKQNTRKLNADKYSDPNWSGNYFGGGSSSFGSEAQRGFDIATGITRPAMSLPFSSTLSGGGISGGLAGNSRLDKLENTLQMVADMCVANTEMTQTVVERFQAVSPGDVLTMGAKQRPSAIADAYESELSRKPRRTEKFMRQTGQNR